MQIALILLVEIALLVLCFKKGVAWLTGLMLVNFICVVLTSGVQINYRFGISNVGNLWYPFILNILALIYYKYGEEQAKNALGFTFTFLLSLICFRYLAIHFNTVNPDDALINAYELVNQSVLNTLIASVVAFVAAQSLLLMSLNYGKFSPIINFLVGVTAAELVDSVIFFYFLINDWNKFIEFFWVGFVVKTVLHLLFAPFLIFLLRSDNGVIGGQTTNPRNC